MFYDDLPIWGFIGKLEKVSKPSGIEKRYFIFTHVHFEILWNLQHIVEINVSTDPNQVVDISEDIVGSSPDATVPAEFTYSAKWKESEITFDKRMDKYRRNQFLPQHLEVAQLHLSYCSVLTYVHSCFQFAYPDVSVASLQGWVWHVLQLCYQSLAQVLND